MAAAARIARSAFQIPKKGETFELRNGLVSQYAYERKEAIQKTIAAMTLGKDVSALFPDVLKNIATHDLGQKKLVYLYLMNYAKSHPELCILAVNTFVQDSEDPNPLVRALAIRTMGCIRVDKMVDYLGEPLRKCLKDESPYVRKTAVICVAKLFDLNQSMFLENGFLELLQDTVNDANPMVVANAIQALTEIHEAAPELNAFDINGSIHTKLLVALNECTEYYPLEDLCSLSELFGDPSALFPWGRVTLLEALAKYRTTDQKDAEHICERVVPQFQHQNASVVMAAVKVIMLNLNAVGPEMHRSLIKKMGPPLVTMISSAPEVQYVALRNISLILQKQPDILSKEWRIFCCRFNDPDYLKHEKLDIMVKLANDKNVDQLLMELKEYATEIDVDFVRRAVRAIGLCALKISEASERSINVLLDLVNTKVNYVVQEAVCVIKDILRKYPNRYENVIPTLAENLDALDDPAARASLIWMIGEYAEKITNAAELLETFVESFKDEPTSVQLQLLTATVKLFLKKGSGAQELVQRLLKTATSECDNPDIRDRAYIYWRLLSASGQVAKSVVLSDKPPLNATQQVLNPRLLDELVSELGSLASVYHKPKDSFVGKGRFGADAIQRRAVEEQIRNAQENPIQATTKSNVENLLDLDMSAGVEESVPSPVATTPNNTMTSILDDLGGLSLATSSGPASRVTSPPPQNQFMSPVAPPMQVASPPPQNQFTSPVMASNTFGSPPPSTVGNNMDDLLGIFGGGGQSNNAFGGANVWNDQPQQNGTQAGKSKSTNDDILGLF